MIAQQDHELEPWLYGIVNNKPNRPGDFLKSLADAAFRADYGNYPLLRPALLAIREVYPQYNDPDPENPVPLSPETRTCGDCSNAPAKFRVKASWGATIELCETCAERFRALGNKLEPLS